MEGGEIEKIFSFLERVWQEKNPPLRKNIESRGDTPFQVLVSTVLSSRTRDETTYAVARRLFKVLREPEDFLNVSLEEIERMIYPVGFYRTKARLIKRLSEIIVREYNGNVPSKVGDLMKLPGVGRKTANLVLSVAFGEDAIAVDTHVHRISNRLGIVSTKTPEETERELVKILPREYWKKLNHLLVGFGQTICKPVRPMCRECELREICRWYAEHHMPSP